MAPLWGESEGALVAWQPFSRPVSLPHPLHLCAGGETEHRQRGGPAHLSRIIKWPRGQCPPAWAAAGECPQDRELWWARAGTGLRLPTPPHRLRLSDIGESPPAA